MADQEVQLAGIGTKIIMDTEDTLSGLSAQSITFRKPSGEFGTWTADDEGGGEISYTTDSADDLDESGRWTLQANVTVTSWSGAGKRAYLLVRPNV